jgi:hypothetical protein
LYGHVILDDLKQVTQKSLEHLESSSTVVHAITDTLDIEALPNNIPALLRQLNAQQHRNSGYTIIITSNKLISFMSNTVLQVLKLNVRIVRTTDDAKKILTQLGVTKVPL